MLGQLLKNLGLSIKEARVYEATLELGPASLQQIANKAGVLRTSGYIYIRSLIKRGLVSSFERGKKTYFSVEDPENLKNFLNRQKEGFDQAASLLKKELPRLKAVFATADERPRVRLFEGKDGLLSLADDFMKSKFETAEEFVNMDKAYELTPPSNKDHRQALIRKFGNRPMRILYTSQQGPFLKAKEGNRERRFMPTTQFPYPGSVTIYGNKVALISQNSHFVGVILENKTIADTLRVLFNSAWEAVEH